MTQEQLAQSVGITEKTYRRLSRSEALEIYRRMVFNVVARNQDDQAKNFAFLLHSGDSQWRLAPAYDVAYSYRKDSPWVETHQLTLNGKRDDFVRADLHQLAESCIGHFSRKAADEIIDRTIAVVSDWGRYAKQVGVFAALQQEIEKNLRLKL